MINKKNKRIVLKFGTEVLSHQLDGERSKKIDESKIYLIAQTVADYKKATGNEVIIVTSGSSLAGCYRNREDYPKLEDFVSESNQRQAYADRLAELSVAGMATLANLYQESFNNYGLNADYCVVTNGDITNNMQSPGINRRIDNILSRNRVPVINTNDFATIEELMPKYKENGFSDNDMLACIVSEFASANELYFVTRCIVHDGNPYESTDTRKIEQYSLSNPPAISFGNKSDYGSGGMKNKIEAACRAKSAGIKSHIITFDMIKLIASNKNIGTTFVE